MIRSKRPGRRYWNQIPFQLKCAAQLDNVKNKLRRRKIKNISVGFVEWNQFDTIFPDNCVVGGVKLEFDFDELGVYWPTSEIKKNLVAILCRAEKFNSAIWTSIIGFYLVINVFTLYDGDFMMLWDVLKRSIVEDINSLSGKERREVIVTLQWMHFKCEWRILWTNE